MKKLRIGLRLKFIMIFLVFSVIISAAVGWITYNSYKGAVLNKYCTDATYIANLASSIIDGDKFVEYSETLLTDEEYEETQKRLNNIKRYSNANYLYVAKPISDIQTIYIYDTWITEEKPEGVGALGDKETYNTSLSSAPTVMKTGETSKDFEITKTKFGYYASIYAPVKTSEGITVGFVGLDISMNEIYTFINNSIIRLIVIMMSIIGGCFAVLLLLVQNAVIRPIRTLKNCVEGMSNGQLGVQVPVRGKDEIAEISEVFNIMSYNIGEHIKEVTELNNGYYKFVPLKIFELLKKKSIIEVQLGDYRENSLTVLNMQINEFDKMVEQLEPKELFTVINQVYHEFVPKIFNNDGIIGEYGKGGFTAIYHNNTSYALNSAITICQTLNELQKADANPIFKEIQVGFGISLGTIILGIVGCDERFATAMISDQMTIAEHLKTAASKYHSRILISGSASVQINDFETAYHSRFIGLLYCKTSGRTEKVYDVYDGDKAGDIELKESTKVKFEEGVKDFLSMRFYESRRCFIEVLKKNRLDFAAREYLYLCNQYYQMKELDHVSIYIEEC